MRILECAERIQRKREREREREEESEGEREKTNYERNILFHCLATNAV
jgi:hypothetical protein